MQKRAQSSGIHKQKRSVVCCFIEISILLAVLVGVLVGLVYYFGNEQLHIDVPHALDEIFSSDQHKNLITKLSKKAYQHTVLYGANQTGIFEFLEHYADTRASLSGLVIVRRLQNNAFETALKFIRFTKDVIQQNFNLQDQSQKVEWIFLVKNGQIPQQEIQKIRTKRTKDRVIVGVTQKIKDLKQFKKIKFPQIPLAFVTQVIASQFEVTSKQAQILVNYYQTIPQIVHNLDQISYTHQKHLGQNYQNYKDLGKKQIKTLKNLCDKGVTTVQGNKVPLEEVGVAIFDGKAYWEKRVNRLNYQLNKKVICKDKVVPPQIAVKIAELKQQQSKQQIEAQTQNQPTQPVAVTKQTKKTKQASKTTKKTEKAPKKQVKETKEQVEQTKTTKKAKKSAKSK